jgi:antitoxin component of MazEF toxin-antitoxin module
MSELPKSELKEAMEIRCLMHQNNSLVARCDSYKKEIEDLRKQLEMAKQAHFAESLAQAANEPITSMEEQELSHPQSCSHQAELAVYEQQIE